MDQEWQEIFNLSEKDHDEWKKTDQTDSFPIWAIKHNKLHLDQYIDWAMQHHHVPFLKDSFFYDIEITQQFWNSTKDREKWNKDFLPIYEWENTLFVACLEPPEKKQDNIIPILTSPKNLKDCWNKIQSFSQFESKALKKSNKTKDENLATNTGILKSLLNTVVNSSLLTKITASSENQVYNQVFQISKKYFTGVIIFSFHDTLFTPIEWSDSMEGPANPVKIDKPSIFKMIANSKNPYHGFIIKNDQHSQFFASWGFAELPEHVTLVPLFNSSKEIIGAFMGISNKMIHQRHLKEIVAWTHPIAKAILKTEAQEKKAA